jgi:hypothetical protein
VLGRPARSKTAIRRNFSTYCPQDDRCSDDRLCTRAISYGKTAPRIGVANHQKSDSWTVPAAECRASYPRAPHRNRSRVVYRCPSRPSLRICRVPSGIQGRQLIALMVWRQFAAQVLLTEAKANA